MHRKDILPVLRKKKNCDMSPIFLVVLIESREFRTLIFQFDIWIHCPRIRAIYGNAKEKIITIKYYFAYCNLLSLSSP